MNKEYKQCPLCGNTKFTIEPTHQNGWELLLCENCFKAQIHESIWYCLEQTLNCNTTEIKKRFSAIYNFLMQYPYFAPNGYEKEYFWFAVHGNNPTSNFSPKQIAIEYLMQDYPKNTSQKNQQNIIESL